MRRRYGPYLLLFDFLWVWNRCTDLDDDSYLDEDKRRILKKFFGNFKDTQNTELKRRFMALWNHLYDIYTDFNQRLASQGLAYEGALYRHVIEADTLNLRYDTYLFVGFNMMQQVETAISLIGSASCKEVFWRNISLIVM